MQLLHVTTIFRDPSAFIIYRVSFHKSSIM